MFSKKQEEQLPNGCAKRYSRAYGNRDILIVLRVYMVHFCAKNSRIFNRDEREGNGAIFKVDTKDVVNYFDMQLFTDAERSLYSRVSEEMYINCIDLAVKYWESKNDASIARKEYICIENLLLSEIVN